MLLMEEEFLIMEVMVGVALTCRGVDLYWLSSEVVEDILKLVVVVEMVEDVELVERLEVEVMVEEVEGWLPLEIRFISLDILLI